MRITLFILSVLCFVMGSADFLGAETVMQQLLGALFLLTAAVLLTGAAAVEAASSTKKKLEEIKTTAATVEAQLKKLVDEAVKTEGVPPPPGKEKYYLAMPDGVTGPHTTGEIESFLSKGVINQSHFILKDGTKDWQRCSEVFELQSA